MLKWCDFLWLRNIFQFRKICRLQYDLIYDMISKGFFPTAKHIQIPVSISLSLRNWNISKAPLHSFNCLNVAYRHVSLVHSNLQTITEIGAWLDSLICVSNKVELCRCSPSDSFQKGVFPLFTPGSLTLAVKGQVYNSCIDTDIFYLAWLVPLM